MGVFGSRMASLAISAVVFATSFAPSHAFAPLPAPLKVERASDVEAVQYYRRRGPAEYNGRGGYYRRGGYHYYNGHRGYTSYRRGYRQYNGYWFPLGAFATGAIIGGAIAAQPTVRYGGSHTEWCYNRYRSYRAYDNTFQPYNGPRQQCISPY